MMMVNQSRSSVSSLKLEQGPAPPAPPQERQGDGRRGDGVAVLGRGGCGVRMKCIWVGHRPSTSLCFQKGGREARKRTEASAEKMPFCGISSPFSLSRWQRQQRSLCVFIVHRRPLACHINAYLLPASRGSRLTQRKANSVVKPSAIEQPQLPRTCTARPHVPLPPLFDRRSSSHAQERSRQQHHFLSFNLHQEAQPSHGAQVSRKGDERTGRGREGYTDMPNLGN
jgi:hypothetical protein